MADTRPDTNIPARQWVELYELTGIEPGVAVTVYNKGLSYINLAMSPSEPESSGMGFPLAPLPNTLAFASIPSGSLRLWAYCQASTKVLVQE